MSTLLVGGASLNQTPIDWNNNTSNIVAAVEQAKKNKVDILGLPELCITGYGCEDLFLSEWIYKKAFRELEHIVAHCQGLLVAIGFPFLHQNKRYNATAIIEDAQLKGIYFKQNMANDGVHYESRWFQPWPSATQDTFLYNQQNIPVGDIQCTYKGVKIGFEICEDAWTENRPACRLQELGVDLIINPSASHFAMGKTQERLHLVQSSSKDFSCAYLYVNLLGNEAGRIIYDGDVVLSQNGKIQIYGPRLSFAPFQLTFAPIYFGKEASNAIDQPVEIPTKEQEFLAAATLGLFDYLRKSRSRCFVLSLSGGADSATCAVLVDLMVKKGTDTLGMEKFCKALHIENNNYTNKDLCKKLLITAYQGSKNSSNTTLQAAQHLAHYIGATFYDWKIDTEVSSNIEDIETAIGRKLSWEMDDITLQNIQARVRAPKIWMLANIFNGLLLTTSNRSEGDVGYATMDGDTSGSIAPIAGVDKPFIRHWLLWAETALGYKGLGPINAQNPTAELRPQESAQEDEKDLMPYDIMVQIERLLVKNKHSVEQTFFLLRDQNPTLETKTLFSFLNKFLQLWSRNQWKRERLAPSFHLDDFNIDPRSWMRNPILSGGYLEESELLAKKLGL